jgi:predicted negative regulator of RcsB-dependent stress response
VPGGVSENLPIILIEVLVFGGVLAFGWWQLRSVRRDRAQSQARQRAAEEKSDTAEGGNDERLP